MQNTPKIEIRKIEITLIDDPIDPMRSGLNMDEIAALSESIKTVGLINPITVRPKGERFEVVAGHRRLVACRIANLSPIECCLRELNDDEVVGVMAIENLDRENVDPVDEALFIGKYVGEDDSKVAELSQRIKRSPAWIRDRLTILSYSEILIAAIRTGQISLGVAKHLGRIENEKIQDFYVRNAMTNPITVLQAEYQYNLWKSGALDNVENPPPAPDDLSPQEQARARAVCARCGKWAVDPNLHSVFVHKECPQDESEPH